MSSSRKRMRKHEGCVCVYVCDINHSSAGGQNVQPTVMEHVAKGQSRTTFPESKILIFSTGYLGYWKSAT